jgi:hypothetical protein
LKISMLHVEVFPLPRWGVRNVPTCFLIPVPDGNAVVIVSDAGAPVWQPVTATTVMSPKPDAGRSLGHISTVIGTACRDPAASSDGRGSVVLNTSSLREEEVCSDPLREPFLNSSEQVV